MARPRNVSDEAILEAARAALVEDPSVSTGSIADRVGLSQAALFKRFGTKLGLIHRALDLGVPPNWVSVCDRGPDDRPLPEQLREIGIEMNAFFMMMVPRFAASKALGIDIRALLASKNTPPPPVVGYQAMRGWVARAMTRGLLRTTDPGSVAISFMGSFQARAFWKHMGGSWFPTPIPDDEAYVANVVDQFWRGLAPEERAP